jgi:hypothetical protein
MAVTGTAKDDFGEDGRKTAGGMLLGRAVLPPIPFFNTENGQFPIFSMLSAIDHNTQRGSKGRPKDILLTFMSIFFMG